MQSVLNVRMDSVLKERGDKVLSENGISVSAAVRALWSQLANTRALPDFLKNADDRECAKQAKRDALTKLAALASEGSFQPSDNALSPEKMYEKMWVEYEALP